MVEQQLGRLPIDELSIAIVGARHDNKKRKGKPTGNRLTEILMIAPGDPIRLVAEPDNPVDKDAIAAYAQTGVQIGYVLADRTKLFRLNAEAGRLPIAIFQQATPGGCIIRVSFTGEPPTLPPAGEVVEQPDVREADEVRDAGVDGDGFWPDEIPSDD